MYPIQFLSQFLNCWPRLFVLGLEASLEGVYDGLLVVDLAQEVVLEFGQTCKRNMVKVIPTVTYLINTDIFEL